MQQRQSARRDAIAFVPGMSRRECEVVHVTARSPCRNGLNRNALNINSISPELREMRNQTMLFVFGL
jgi:hypothetical protein